MSVLNAAVTYPGRIVRADDIALTVIPENAVGDIRVAAFGNINPVKTVAGNRDVGNCR